MRVRFIFAVELIKNKQNSILMKTKIIYGFISLGLITLAFIVSGFLIQSKAEPKVENAKQNSMYVKTQNVSLKEIQSNMAYRGRVSAYDNIALAAEVSGKIMQGDVRFKSGEQFKKNDVLLKIYSRDVEAALKSSKSSYLQIISKILPDLQVDFEDQFQKWNEFFQDIDPLKPLPTLPEISSNQEKVFLASNNVLSNYYNLQQQEINLSKYQIRAPFDGTFKKVNKEIGAVASPGAELANISRTNKLEIIVSIFPEDLKWLKKGDQVKISDNYGLVEHATISRISSFVDETTQSANIYLTYFPKVECSILEGEFIDVFFKGAAVNGFEIPREALINKKEVLELVNQKLIKKPVEIVRSLDDSYIITGIDSNKIVVIESLASVNDQITYLAR